MIKKRAATFSVIIIFLEMIFCTQIKGYSDFHISTNSTEATYPSISGNFVVWEGATIPVVGYNLLNKTQFTVYDWYSCSSPPDIYGSTVVFSEDFGTVVTRNLLDDILNYPNISPNLNIDPNPAISTNYIVWDSKSSNSTNRTIVIYDLSLNQEVPFKGKVISNSQYPYSNLNPDVDGNYLVWQDQRGIRGYNISQSIEFPISNEVHSSNPAINANMVIWQQGSIGNQEIYGYDISTGEVFSVCIGTWDKANPTISGNTIVWQDQRNGNWDIWGYDLSTGSEFPIYTGIGDQINPSISDSTVVWVDNRNGNYEIYGTYIPEPFTFSLLILGSMALLIRRKS